MSRRLTVVALALVAGLAVLGMPTQSGATYVARTTNSVSTVASAADWTPPTVALRNPGSPVKDTVVLTADATDGESGVASVAIQALAPGGSSWTTICTATTAPYSCSWSTKAGSDGSWSLRAIATDRAGYSTTSAVVDTTVANNLLVQLADPGDIVKGAVTLTASLFNTGTVSYAVKVEYAPTGTTTWKTLCTTTATAPYTCTWTTTANGYTQGASYDLRAVATAGSSSTTSAVVVDVLVDNVAPTTTMTDPGSPLRGTVTLAATATDAESGVAQVVLQWQRSGTSTWTTACTLSLEPFSCRFDTTALADGTYSFRSVATDVAGNTSTSLVTNRTVDNTVSAVAMEDPGAFLSGTVALTATASSTAGVTSVRIDRAPSGTTTWTTVCTDTTSPYSCGWDTTTVADGFYDFRAVLVDGKGVTTTSTTVSARRVDNSPLRGYDVQAVSGGATAGRLDTGDTIRFTYTDQVNPASVTAGWNGTAALAVTLRLRDGGLVGLGAKGDTLDVLRSGASVNLGSVNLNNDYIKGGKTAQFNATMTMSTATVNGTTSSVVTITLGALASGGGLRTPGGTGNMVWTPSASVTDLGGQTSSAAPTTELGTADRDF
ncbi:Ig-like domain-containing protein [Nocardioides marmoribigeumensis]|uniref:Signal peptidase I n=1 Tax=Nocardioides marmoribigeumensis TaxID=433649 RepID=A0ABU2BV87_9ACTN|nr:Ig-like domain-containing protein [Nocardioides marmoribigeumensis]MDR7362171.1 hypothetical protein [Nocardioides marmoribigeumensis]